MMKRTDLSRIERLKIEASFVFRHRHNLSHIYNKRVVPLMDKMISEKEIITESISKAERPALIQFHVGDEGIEEITEMLYARMELLAAEIQKYSPTAFTDWSEKQNGDLDLLILQWTSDIPRKDDEISKLCECLHKF
jgi:hypothetical protein